MNALLPTGGPSKLAVLITLHSDRSVNSMFLEIKQEVHSFCGK